jgi:regulator of replication initiation timing
MSASGYARGSKVISRQIDDQLKAEQKSRDDRAMFAQLGVLRRENDALKAENARLRQAWENRGIYLKAEREYRYEVQTSVADKHDAMMTWMRQALQLSLQVTKLSAMLRMFTPEQVEDARRDARSIYPHLWKDRP